MIIMKQKYREAFYEWEKLVKPLHEINLQDGSARISKSRVCETEGDTMTFEPPIPTANMPLVSIRRATVNGDIRFYPQSENGFMSPVFLDTDTRKGRVAAAAQT